MNKSIILDWISVHHPMTYIEVKSVAEILEVELPEDYCSLIGPINGGALRSAFIEDFGGKRISYSRNVSLSRADKANIFILYAPESERGSRYFPFGSVGNGDYFCFDLKEKNVVLWQHENNRCILICKTFTELLTMIHEEEDTL